MAFKEIFQKFAGDLRAAKKAILIPSEQITADQQLAWGLHELGESCNELDTLLGLAEKEIADAASNAAATALAEAIKAGTHFEKSAHELAVNAAKQTARDEAMTEFKALAEAKEFVAKKRAEAAAIVTAEYAALIPDELLAADKADATLSTLQARAEALKEKGVTTDTLPAAFKIVASITDPALYEASIAPTLDIIAKNGGKFSVTASKDKKQDKVDVNPGNPGATVKDEADLL